MNSKIRPSASPTAAHRTPPRCSGPVGLADTNSRLIFSPVNALEEPYDAPAATMSAATCPWAPASTVMLRNPGPAISTAAMPSDSSSSAASSSAELPRVHPRLLGQLQRDVRGVVAVSLLSRPLDRHPRRDAVGQGERTWSTSADRQSTMAADSCSGFTGQGYRRAQVSLARISPGKVPHRAANATGTGAGPP